MTRIYYRQSVFDKRLQHSSSLYTIVSIRITFLRRNKASAEDLHILHESSKIGSILESSPFRMQA